MWYVNTNVHYMLTYLLFNFAYLNTCVNKDISLYLTLFVSVFTASYAAEKLHLFF